MRSNEYNYNDYVQHVSQYPFSVIFTFRHHTIMCLILKCSVADTNINVLGYFFLIYLMQLLYYVVVGLLLNFDCVYSQGILTITIALQYFSVLVQQLVLVSSGVLESWEFVNGYIIFTVGTNLSQQASQLSTESTSDLNKQAELLMARLSKPNIICSLWLVRTQYNASV